MSESFSQIQKDRIEENRKKALAIRAAKLRESQASSSAASAAQVSANSFYQKSSVSSVQPAKSALSSDKQAGNSMVTQGSSKKDWKDYANINKPYDLPKKGSLVLVSRERFELVMDFHQPTIDLVKTLPGREYNPNKRLWNFPLKNYDAVLTALKKLHPAVVVGELPSLVVDTFVKRKHSFSSEVDVSRIQSSLRSTLMDFQVDSVKYAVSREGRVLIADDMGLGKTLQALAIADYYKADWPLLIVCPSSMRYQWVAEIKKYLVNVDPDSIFVIRNGKDVMYSDSKVIITSYDLMSTFKEQLLAKNFGVVIMDESHHLKNPKALRTKTATSIVMKCKRCVMLTGTPVLSRPVELHCQLQCIRPQIFNKFMDFAVRYCDAKKNRFGWDFSGSSNMAELNLLLKELLMIRRLKSEVLSQLPPKTREVVILESNGTKLSETSELAKVLDGEGLKGLNKHSTLMAYFQETASAKTKKVTQYVEDMIERGEKFLVFAHHTVMMDAICIAVEKKRTDYIRIDGSVGSDVRKDLCSHFQEQENCLVGVLSIKAANTGLTLTAARLVIFAELYWNPGDLIQAEDRAHRIGQADSVLIQYLVQQGTADDKIWPILQSKLNILNEAGLAQDQFRIEDTIKSQPKKEDGKDITDYFLHEDDTALAELDLDALESSFEIPNKKQRLD